MRVTLLALAALLCTALPANADTILFDAWGDTLLCPHGWYVEPTDGMISLYPTDEAAYPGAGVSFMAPGFWLEFEFADEEVGAAFELFTRGYQVHERQPVETIALDNSTLELISAQGHVTDTDIKESGHIAIVLIVDSGNPESRHWLMLTGNTADALEWAKYVAGVSIVGLTREVKPEEVRDFRLPESFEE